VLAAAQDVINTFAGYSDYLEMYGREPLEAIMVAPDARKPNGVNGLPRLSGRFHVSGVSALMKGAETLQQLTQVFLPLSGQPQFAPYLEPYKMLKALETRTNLTDEGIVVNDEMAAQIKEEIKAAAAAEREKADQSESLAQTTQLFEMLKGLVGEKGSAGEGSKPKAVKGNKK
jgi:hypothetical protein